jgi:hypothetical protein
MRGEAGLVIGVSAPGRVIVSDPDEIERDRETYLFWYFLLLPNFQKLLQVLGNIDSVLTTNTKLTGELTHHLLIRPPPFCLPFDGRYCHPLKHVYQLFPFLPIHVQLLQTLSSKRQVGEQVYRPGVDFFRFVITLELGICHPGEDQAGFPMI